MVRKFETKEVKVISDLHFGRKFRTGVSLDRRGEIEKMIEDSFVQELKTVGEYQTLIIAGDLFDSPFVDTDTIFKVYEHLKDLIGAVYLIAGNHDLSRDPTKKTAWDILKEMLSGNPYIKMIKDEPFYDKIRDILLVPWDCEEKVTEEQVKKANFIIGHFELNSLSKMPEIPHTTLVISGHYHLPQKSYGIQYVGSILPLTFGEYDIYNDFEYMRTLTLSEYEEQKESLKNVRVRIRLKQGEELPIEDNIALQLVGVNDIEESELSLKVEDTDGNLDLKSIFDKCLIDCKRKNELWFRYIQLKGVTD